MSDQIATQDHQQAGTEFLRSQQRPRPDADHAAAVGDQVFKAMHAFYGSLWLNKFSTHAVTATGGDEGFENARRTWGAALSRYTGDVVRSAFGRCVTAHPEFPPNLPQFVALCEASRPRETYRAPDASIGMSQELRSSYARRLREVNQRHLQGARDKAAGGSGRMADSELVGLPLLHTLVAESVGLAGGDEADALLRLDRAQLAARETKTQMRQTHT